MLEDKDEWKCVRWGACTACGWIGQNYTRTEGVAGLAFGCPKCKSIGTIAMALTYHIALMTVQQRQARIAEY